MIYLLVLLKYKQISFFYFTDSDCIFSKLQVNSPEILSSTKLKPIFREINSHVDKSLHTDLRDPLVLMVIALKFA